MKSIYLKSVLAFIFVGVMAMIVCILRIFMKGDHSITSIEIG